MGWTKLLTGVLALSAFLISAAIVDFVRAESSPHAALTGKVSSQAEGPMEGVVIGAKKAGSPITTWVVSDAQGRFSFPRGAHGTGQIRDQHASGRIRVAEHFCGSDRAAGHSSICSSIRSPAPPNWPCNSPMPSGA